MSSLNPIASGIFIIILTAIFLGILKFIDKNNKTKFFTINEYLIFSTLGFAASCIFLYFKSLSFFDFMVISTLFLYLSVNGYIDFLSKSVYRFLHYIFLAVAVIYMIINTPELKPQFLYFILYILLIVLFLKIGSFGNGDGYILMVSAVYLLFLNLGLDYLIFCLINTLLFSIIFLFAHIKLIDFKKMRLKETRPLAPFIALSTILMVLIV